MEWNLWHKYISRNLLLTPITVIFPWDYKITDFISDFKAQLVNDINNDIIFLTSVKAQNYAERCGFALYYEVVFPPLNSLYRSSLHIDDFYIN